MDFEKLFHSNMNCAVCRKPIKGRSVEVLNKHYHPEHFTCTKCQQPLKGIEDFGEYRGLPYCKTHYNELTSQHCGLCFEAITTNVVSAIGMHWCADHFICFGCGENMASEGFKYAHWDGKPLCGKCNADIPNAVYKHIAQYAELERKIQKPKSREQLNANALERSRSNDKLTRGKTQ